MLAATASQKRALILGYVWPEPTSSAAGLRTLSLTQIFRELNCQITFVSPSRDNEFRSALERQGIRTHIFEANDSRFDAFVAELQPDFVVFDRFVMEEQFGWRVRTHSPKSMRILDTQDLHFLRRARKVALDAGVDLQKIYTGDIQLHSDDLLRETASIYRSDLTLVISDFELALLRDRFQIPKELLFHLPLLYPGAQAGADFSDRKDFVMIGNFRHPPNHDAVMWTNREIWPLIKRAIPSAELHLYGAYPPKEISALHDPRSGFLVKGWTPDQYATLARYRVNLAPLRFGAGMKGKIADGWSVGTPVVTTPIGAEGMFNGGVGGGKVASTAQGIAEDAVLLHESEDEWRKCRATAVRDVEEKFGYRSHAEALRRELENRAADIDESRTSNLVGQMLWHQLYRSTEYFSRWIEAKNRTQS